jgi:hypothetical protein
MIPMVRAGECIGFEFFEQRLCEYCGDCAVSAGHHHPQKNELASLPPPHAWQKRSPSQARQQALRPVARGWRW